VIWINLPTGGRVCVDPRPVVYIVYEGPNGTSGVNAKDVLGEIALIDRLGGRPVAGAFVSHFATCPYVDKMKQDQARKK